MYLSKYDSDYIVRRYAIEKVSDIETLKYVVLNDDDKMNRWIALSKMNKENVPSALIEEYESAQNWKKAEEGRTDRERENKRVGHQCPHCHSYNLSVRSDAGIHCWDCGRDSIHYL